MNAKTKEAIENPGRALLAIFPQATETNPVALCKKIRRIETAAERIGLALCENPGYSYEQADRDTEKALARVRALLGITDAKAAEIGLFVNRDPRGYALKLSDDWTRGYNSTAENRLHSDLGGYGILAPDLTA